MTLGVFIHPEVVKVRRGGGFLPSFAPVHKTLFLLLAANLQCQPIRKEGKQRQTLVSLGQQQGKGKGLQVPLHFPDCARSQAASPSCGEAHMANPASTLWERNFGVQRFAKSFHHVPGEMSSDTAGTSKHSEGRSAVNSSKVS